ncbi:MAG: mycofactocin biosynthesis glycosyltransferase MftF [Actinomycetota bacterium]
MSSIIPAPASRDTHELARGTRVILDASAEFVGAEILAGGSPWRVLRLPGASREVAEAWRHGGQVDESSARFARTLITYGLLHPEYPNVADLSEVTVVIPHWNDERGLTTTLRSCRGLSVVVVDDGSDDVGAWRSIADEFGARTISLEENSGPGFARNQGAAGVTTDFVLFLDTGLAVADLTSVVGRLLSHCNDPRVAVVAPRITGGHEDSWRSGFEKRFSPLDLGPASSLVTPQSRVSYVPSAALLVRRSAIGEGFDTSIRVGEDVDLVWRLHDAGWLIRYDASVTVAHPARDSWSAWWRQRHAYGLSAAALAERHPGRLAPAHIDPWSFLSWVALAFGRVRIATASSLVAQQIIQRQLPETLSDAPDVARHLVIRGLWRSAGPTGRSLVRSFGPLLLAATLLRYLRRPALAIFIVGTCVRWRGQSRVVPRDIPLAVADDLAYASGLWRGAVTRRQWSVVTPQVSKIPVTIPDTIRWLKNVIRSER